MANSNHFSALKLGANAWNAWRLENPGIVPDLRDVKLMGRVGEEPPSGDLSSADFSGADLTGAVLWNLNIHSAKFVNAKLTSADLRASNFRGADFSGADLRYAALNGASLERAVLRDADLADAKLYQVNLSDAVIIRCNFERADLRGALFVATTLDSVNFKEVRLGGTVFAKVDLRGCVALADCNHVAPSTVGVDTVYASAAQIPDTFLKQAGVADTFLAYTRALVGSAIEMYSCFISYSASDEEFAKRIYADLQAAGVRCWFAPHSVKGGQKLHEQIDEAIRLHDRLLLVLSTHSMESEWVKTEIAKARRREVLEKSRVLFPISVVPFEVIKDWECFDGDRGKDSAREIREYFIPDFSQWKQHDRYIEAFTRLLQGLAVHTPRC